jgi:hypothetical protein
VHERICPRLSRQRKEPQEAKTDSRRRTDRRGSYKIPVRLKNGLLFPEDHIVGFRGDMAFKVGIGFLDGGGAKG